MKTNQHRKHYSKRSKRVFHELNKVLGYKVCPTCGEVLGDE